MLGPFRRRCAESSSDLESRDHVHSFLSRECVGHGVLDILRSRDAVVDELFVWFKFHRFEFFAVIYVFLVFGKGVHYRCRSCNPLGDGSVDANGAREASVDALIEILGCALVGELGRYVGDILLVEGRS